MLLNFLLQVLVGETYSILNPEHAPDYNVHDSKVEQEGAKGCEGKVLEKRFGGRDNHTHRKEQCEYVEHESGHTFTQIYEKFCSRHKNFLLIKNQKQYSRNCFVKINYLSGLLLRLFCSAKSISIFPLSFLCNIGYQFAIVSKTPFHFILQ